MIARNWSQGLASTLSMLVLVAAPGAVRADDDRTAVVEAVRAHQDEIKACFDLREDSAASGKLEVGFSVEPNGTTSDVAIAEDTLGQPAVAECLVGVLRTLRVEPPPGNRRAYRFPFIFSPAP